MYLIHASPAERRALFLSKLHAPPSPTATTTPETPPESPLVFHYTLPSPCLTSPLAVFEAVDKIPAEALAQISEDLGAAMVGLTM
jgi:hypothetical protein